MTVSMLVTLSTSPTVACVGVCIAVGVDVSVLVDEGDGVNVVAVAVVRDVCLKICGKPLHRLFSFFPFCGILPPCSFHGNCFQIGMDYLQKAEASCAEELTSDFIRVSSVLWYCATLHSRSGCDLCTALGSTMDPYQTLSSSSHPSRS